MANIMFDNPIPYEGIAEGRRKEQALGSEMASNMMQSYFRAQALRAQREQWADETPLRNARLTLLSAQAVNEKATAEAQAIEAMRSARRREKYAELGALQEEAAGAGWDAPSEAKFYNFLSKNPEFVGSKEADAVGENFMKSRLLRERMEQQYADIGDPTIWTDPETGVRFTVGPRGAMRELPSETRVITDPRTGKPLEDAIRSGTKIIRTPRDLSLSPDVQALPIPDAVTGEPTIGVRNIGGKVVSIPVNNYETLIQSLEKGGASTTNATVQQSPSGPPTTLKSVIGEVINKAMNFGRSSPTNASAAPSGSAAPASSTLEQANQIRSAVAAGTMTREDGIARLRELGFK